MINYRNALSAALAHLQSIPAGAVCSMGIRAKDFVENLDEWCAKNEVKYRVEGERLILWKENHEMRDGERKTSANTVTNL